MSHKIEYLYTPTIYGKAATPWYRAGGAPAPVAAWQPKGAASLALSYKNLANPGTYDAAPGSAPAFNTATGWTFNGTSNYLTTGLVPTCNCTWSILVRYADFSGRTGSTPIGEYGTASMEILFNTDGIHVFHGGSASTNAVAATSGNYGFAGLKCYRDGVEENNSIPSNPRTTSFQLHIASECYNNAPGNYFPGSIQAVAVWDVTLTGPQVAAIVTAMQAL